MEVATIVVLSTGGATDPDNYLALIGESPAAVRAGMPHEDPDTPQVLEA